jgi:biopolymer transport protein ExbD
MVDLGFLLITFFVFTTSINQPTAMKLIMPDERPDGNPPKVMNEKVLTIIAGGDNKLYYYAGDVVSPVATNYNSGGVRTVLLNKKMEVSRKFGDEKDLVVLIKLTDDASYKNMVDLLDEMAINEIKRFMVVDVTKKDLAAIL